MLSVPNGGALSISVDPLLGVVRQEVRTRSGTGTVPLAGGADLPGTVGAFRPSAGFGPAQSGAIGAGRGDGLQLGQLQGIVSGQLQGTLANEDPQTVRDRVAEARERIFGAPSDSDTDTNASPASQTDNAYTRLLERVKNRGQDDTDADDGQSGEGRPDDATGRDRSGADADDANDLRPDWMKRLAEPPESRIEAAERRMQERLESIRTGVKREDEEARAEAGEAPSAMEAAAARDEAAADLGNLLDRLDYDVRLETLVAQREGRAATLYQNAEEDLAGGRFINAERTYRQLRLEDAANPLSRAGLVHAQLGAGMMRAAAFNLRGCLRPIPN